MRPFLFEHSFLETPTYFLLYSLGFLGALVMASALARRRGLDSVQAIDLGIITFSAGFLGARLFHILFENPDYYLLHPIRIFYVWQGGFVLYGGLIAGILTGIVYLRRKNMDWAIWGDLAAAPILIGIAIGRVGCLAAGCCYGTETAWAWGLVFSDPRSGAPLHVALHPTQILESLGALILSIVFYKLYLKQSLSNGRGIFREGNLFCLSLMAYAVLRFLIEFLRGDADRGVYFGGAVSTSQIIALLVVLGLGLFLSWRSRRMH